MKPLRMKKKARTPTNPSLKKCVSKRRIQKHNNVPRIPSRQIILRKEVNVLITILISFFVFADKSTAFL